MKSLLVSLTILSLPLGVSSLSGANTAEKLTRIAYNNPGLTVDLAAGLWGWPIPCDRNDDGKPDLIISTGSQAYQGVYYYENTGRKDPRTGSDIFKPGVRLGDYQMDVTPSYTPSGLRVLTPGFEHPGFMHAGLKESVKLAVDPAGIHPVPPFVRLWGKQWSYVDYDGDGVLDLTVGVGDYSEYGWDAGYDKLGRWVNGPLHGFVYILRNNGTNATPQYAPPMRLKADNRDVDVYGSVSPVFADFLGQGKLDLVCGEFLDGLTFFQNVGTRTAPRYATGRRLRNGGEVLTMPLQMIIATGYDWNGDRRPDLVVAQEDARVAVFENTGRAIVHTTPIAGGAPADKSIMPEFLPARFLRQEAHEVKFGVLSAPVSFDWDGDGIDDLLSGNSVGEVGFIKNLGGVTPKWAEPVVLEAEGKPIVFPAGYNGSIQGPAEAKFGYTNIGVGDWNGDGLPDILVNTTVGKILWLRNIGTRKAPKLAPPTPLLVEWQGPAPKPAWNWWSPEPGEFATQWRCTPYVIDLDRDGINDLVTVDHEGYLAFFRQIDRGGQRVLQPGKRIFHAKGPSSFDSAQRPLAERDGLLRLNGNEAGKSGRRTFCFMDWDGDGKLDLLVNSINVNFLRNVSTRAGEWLFEDMGPVDGLKLAGHSTSPTSVDWNGDGIPDMLTGSEDGYFYLLKNPRSK